MVGERSVSTTVEIANKFTYCVARELFVPLEKSPTYLVIDLRLPDQWSCFSTRVTMADGDSSPVIQDDGATRTSIRKEWITSNYVRKFCHARNVVLRFVRDRLSSVESMYYVLDVIDDVLARDATAHNRSCFDNRFTEWSIFLLGFDLENEKQYLYTCIAHEWCL